MGMSGGNKAAKAANKREEARQAAIKATQARINDVFNNPERQADINDLVASTRQFYDRDLNRQKGNADRGLTFALARSGLTGGSEDVAQQKLLNESYSRGLLSAEQRAQQAGAGLESQDQQARARLIALATSGLDATTAAQQAAASMQSSLEAGRATARLNGIGNVFANFNKFAQQAKDAQKFREGLNAGLPGGSRAALYGGGISMYGGKH